MRHSNCIDCGVAKRRNECPRCRACARKEVWKTLKRWEPWNKKDGIEVSCQICQKVEVIQPHRLKRYKVCSQKCAHEVKKQTLGKDHPLYKPKVPMACEVCGTVRQVKPSLVSRFRFCSIVCTGAWVSRNQPRISSIEVAVSEVLKQLGIEFQAQVPIGRFTADFVVDDLVIEVDGSYWHSLPKVKERDLRKDVEYKQRGLRVLHLKEQDIRNSDFSALEKALSEKVAA